MDQFATAKWFLKTEKNIKHEIDFDFNPFCAENSSVFPTENPKTKSSVLGSYPSRNIISYAGGNSKSTPKNAYEMCTKSNRHVKSDAIDIVSPVELTFSAPAPVPAARITFEEYYGVLEYDDQAMKSGGRKTTLQSKEHILAERKRREKMSKSFIALSAIVPGLKKLDKTSVLNGAIKHIKELEGRIKNNEEDNSSTVIRKRTRQSFSDDTFSSSEGNKLMRCSHTDDKSSTMPEIDVKISGENVLLRIYCERREMIIKEILYQVANLNLSVNNSSASVFGEFHIYLAIAAEMDGDFCMTAEGLVENIREVILNFI